MTYLRSLLLLLTPVLLWGCDSGGSSSAADAGDPAPVEAVVSGGCQGVRPGAPVFTETGQCSLNFVFRDGSGAEYVGTAGHCILGEAVLGGEDAGERTWQAGQGPEAFDAAGNLIGRFAYAVLSPPKDFALIRIAPGVASDPRVCAFGGPAGINAELTASPTVLRYYGSGLVTGTLLPARTALALSLSDPDEVRVTGVAAPGDSGGPVLDTQGRAVGVLVTVGLLLGGIGLDGIDAGTVGVTRLPPQLQRARQAMGVSSLSLVTAP